jgi:hypothetical protein
MPPYDVSSSARIARTTAHPHCAVRLRQLGNLGRGRAAVAEREGA